MPSASTISRRRACRNMRPGPGWCAFADPASWKMVNLMGAIIVLSSAEAFEPGFAAEALPGGVGREPSAARNNCGRLSGSRVQAPVDGFQNGSEFCPSQALGPGRAVSCLMRSSERCGDEPARQAYMLRRRCRCRSIGPRALAAGELFGRGEAEGVHRL